MSITRMDTPSISTRALLNILQFTIGRKLPRDCNMYDVGYEQCKADLAKLIGTELGIDMNVNPASELIKSIRRAE